MGIAVITMPTTASTDAPTSASAVIYKENGEHERLALFDKNPNMVIVDSRIIVNEPVRYLSAGMGDALATWIEGRACAESATPNYVFAKKFGGLHRTLTGMAIAKESYELLMAKGRSAYLSAKAMALTETLEDIIEVNILMSGMGFENVGCAGAHSIADGMTVLPEGANTLHGEKVAYGCIVELICENRPAEEIDELIEFCLDVDLPITLKDLQIEPSEENIKTIANASMKSLWASEPMDVTQDMVEEYIKMADAIVESHKAKRRH
jgi:glycerol dehydrogenase